MTEPSFVPFTPDAAPTVSGWATTADEVAAWCSRTEVPVPPDVVVGWSRKDDVRAYLLLDAGRPVGYGEVWVDDDEGEVELAHIIVDPGRRGRGVGRALVAHLVDAGRRIHPTVFLRFVPGNTAAEACYTAAGFARVPAEQEREWNEHQPRPYLWMTYQGAAA